MMRPELSVCIPCWDKLSPAHRQRLRENVIVHGYKPGDNVIFNIVKKDGILFILEGKLRVYLASGTGRELTLFELAEGDAFNIMTVDGAKEFDVVPCLQAADRTVLGYLLRADIAPIAYEEPMIADFIFDTCSITAQRILNNVSFYFFNTLRSCVAKVLVEKLRAAPPQDEPQSVRITHEEIANTLGTTRVVVSRELDYLRDLGIIATGRGRISILDLGGLETIAGG